MLVRKAALPFLLSMFIVISTGSLHAADGCLPIVPDYERECGRDIDLVIHRLQNPGDCVSISIHADSYWNASRVILEKDTSYRFEVSTVPESPLADKGQPATPEGWLKRSDELGAISRAVVLLSQPFVRAKGRPLFYLMGSLHGTCKDALGCAETFAIGNGADSSWTSPANGEFCAFLNDVPFMYGNNTGKLQLTVRRQ